MQQRSQRAFTLIELLVVVAVIAILAVMLFPAVSKSMKRGQTATCINNLRQIGAVMLSYAADYEGRMPVLDKMDRDLYAYGISRNLNQGRSLSWTCPARNRAQTFITEPNPISYTGSRNALSWVTNETPHWAWSYQNPSQVLLLADGRENFSWGTWIFIDNYGSDFEYFDDTLPLDRGYNMQTWFESRGFAKTDPVYVEQADVDGEGAPSGIRYRHNNNEGTAAVFAGGNAAYIPVRGLIRGNFVSAW